MIKNQPESNSGKPAPNRLLFPLVILSIFVLSLLFVDVFAVYALSSNSDALSIVSKYQTWANNRFLAELGRVADAHSQLSSTQTQLDSAQQQLASAQAKIILYQNTYGEIESGDAHPFLGPDGQWITLVNNPWPPIRHMRSWKVLCYRIQQTKIFMCPVSMNVRTLPGTFTIMLKKPGYGRLTSAWYFRYRRSATLWMRSRLPIKA